MQQVEHNTLAHQLTDIRLNYETWRKDDPDFTLIYFENMLKMNRIILSETNGIIHGYLEVWRLSYENFGRYICGAHFTPFSFDIQNGPVAFVANTCVVPNKRATSIFDGISKRFFRENQDAEVFTGRRIGKRYKPLVFYKNVNGKLQEVGNG